MAQFRNDIGIRPLTLWHQAQGVSRIIAIRRAFSPVSRASDMARPKASSEAME
jgi:hypothetical protein